MKIQHVCVVLFSSFALFGCNNIGSKTASISVVYACAAIIALMLLLGYCYSKHTKTIWYQMLFICVFVVNLGYFSLSIAKNLNEALLANRISYLGSVFLPFSMLMLILNVLKIEYRKWFPYCLIGIGILVFFIAASPGYSDIYYKEVYLESINGVSFLNKVYGPWHCIYLYYLVLYFSSMILCIIHAISNKKIDSGIEAILLASAVFINICVWFLEQMVKIDFEFLSISYIITELFLLGLQIIIDENANLKRMISDQPEPTTADQNTGDNVSVCTDSISEVPSSVNGSHEISNSNEVDESIAAQIENYIEGLKNLTPTEKLVYELYITGNTTKDIMSSLNIKENTVKFHNKNIYGKLGVSSRKQLLELHKVIERKKTAESQ